MVTFYPHWTINEIIWMFCSFPWGHHFSLSKTKLISIALIFHQWRNKGHIFGRQNGERSEWKMGVRGLAAGRLFGTMPFRTSGNASFSLKTSLSEYKKIPYVWLFGENITTKDFHELFLWCCNFSKLDTESQYNVKRGGREIGYERRCYQGCCFVVLLPRHLCP